MGAQVRDGSPVCCNFCLEAEAEVFLLRFENVIYMKLLKNIILGDKAVFGAKQRCA
jgi:hypothetical protein